jgi:hypothetical protein
VQVRPDDDPVGIVDEARQGQRRCAASDDASHRGRPLPCLGEAGDRGDWASARHDDRRRPGLAGCGDRVAEGNRPDRRTGPVVDVGPDLDRRVAEPVPIGESGRGAAVERAFGPPHDPDPDLEPDERGSGPIGNCEARLGVVARQVEAPDRLRIALREATEQSGNGRRLRGRLVAPWAARGEVLDHQRPETRFQQDVRVTCAAVDDRGN